MKTITQRNLCRVDASRRRAYEKAKGRALLIAVKRAQERFGAEILIDWRADSSAARVGTLQ